jgi:hypothetical protein
MAFTLACLKVTYFTTGKVLGSGTDPVEATSPEKREVRLSGSIIADEGACGVPLYLDAPVNGSAYSDAGAVVGAEPELRYLDAPTQPHQITIRYQYTIPCLCKDPRIPLLELRYRRVLCFSL